jgi:hypothetical protein
VRCIVAEADDSADYKRAIARIKTILNKHPIDHDDDGDPQKGLYHQCEL